MDATTVDPKAHDEATAELYGQRDKAERKLASAIEQAHRAAGDVKIDRWTRRERWGMSIQDVLTKIQAEADAHPADEAIHDWSAINVLRSWDAATAELVRTGQEIAKLDAIYDEQPWQRFFPCNNSNGHIHASLACHTLNKGQYATDMGWYPSLSGHTVAEAVAELGTWLCSVCFPAAPAEHCQTRSEATRAEREAKAAAKAEAKFDKVLRPDEVILDGRLSARTGKGDKVTTVHGLKVVLREVSEFRHYSGINDHQCPDAPNPEDGPMPGHEPGTAAVTNPMWTGAQS
jgi:hypothetical protein